MLLATVPCALRHAACSGTNRVELERAKRAAVSVICNALESKATSAEDIGRQYLTYGRRCVRPHTGHVTGSA